MTTWYDNLLARFNLITLAQHEQLLKNNAQVLKNAIDQCSKNFSAQAVTHERTTVSFTNRLATLTEQKIQAIKMLEDVLHLQFVPKAAKEKIRHITEYLKTGA